MGPGTISWGWKQGGDVVVMGRVGALQDGLAQVDLEGQRTRVLAAVRGAQGDGDDGRQGESAGAIQVFQVLLVSVDAQRLEERQRGQDPVVPRPGTPRGWLGTYGTAQTCRRAQHGGRGPQTLYGHVSASPRLTRL